MPSNAILREVQHLYKVIERLDLLAEEHPLSPKHSSQFQETGSSSNTTASSA
jgi:hypothetical protein